MQRQQRLHINCIVSHENYMRHPQLLRVLLTTTHFIIPSATHPSLRRHHHAHQLLNDYFSHQLPIIQHSAVITTNINVLTANEHGVFSTSRHGTFSGSRHGETSSTALSHHHQHHRHQQTWRKLRQPHHYYIQQKLLQQELQQS